MNRRVLLALALAAHAASALAQPSAPAPGPLLEPRVHSPGPFDSLSVDGAGTVRLFQADRDEILVPGDRHTQDCVSVQRTGSGLHIALGGAAARLGEPVQVEVHVRHLTRLTIAGATTLSAPLSFKTNLLAVKVSGTGFVAFDNLQVPQVSFDIAGPAEARLFGKVDKLKLTAAGATRVNADSLRARSVDATVSDTADVTLWVINEIDAHVGGSARVHYWGGRPAVRRTVTEQGSLDWRGVKYY